LLVRQDRQGWWSGRSATDVTLEAEALLTAEVLGTRTPEATNLAAQQIRSAQQSDGRWTGNGESAAENDGPEAAGDLSASVLAYLALRLAGDSADAYHMAVAAGWIRDAGGIGAVGVLARTWLALFGLADWSDNPVPAPEICYLPGRYAATRPAAVALAILGTMRPIRPLPFEVTELRTGDSAGAAAPSSQPRRRVSAPAVAHTVALRRCGQWLIDWQQRSGLPAARRPSWPCSLVALHVLGYPLDHPALAKGLSWLGAATVRARQPGLARGPVVRQPPVLDTTLALEALAAAQLAADHSALVTAGSWLLLQRIEGPAQGPGPAAGPEPSGWSFGRDGYPVVADTARVLLALSRVKLPGLTGRTAIRNAVRWLTGMQSRDGSWGGSPRVTAHVVRAVAKQGPAQIKAIRRGVVWLLRQQRTDGSWSGSDGSDFGATVAALPALIAAGVRPAKPPVTAAVEWLLGQQNSDGGWAADAHAPEAARRGTSVACAGGSAARPAASDAPSTASAVAALLCVSSAQAADAVDRGADWLIRAQQADGGWRDDIRPARHGGQADRTGSAALTGQRVQSAANGGPGSRSARSSPRRRGAIVPGLILPLGALGQYVAAAEAGVSLNAEAGADVVVGADAVAAADPAAGVGALAGVHADALTALD
jgi:squalene-hopene/tetraprenyl-beta-curcumene cyclase